MSSPPPPPRTHSVSIYTENSMYECVSFSTGWEEAGMAQSTPHRETVDAGNSISFPHSSPFPVPGRSNIRKNLSNFCSVTRDARSRAAPYPASLNSEFAAAAMFDLPYARKNEESPHA